MSPLRASVLLVVTLAAAAARPDAGTSPSSALPPRDPFWPLDYTPPADKTTPQDNRPKTATVTAPRAISEQEWVEAEKTAGIRPARYSLGTGADGAAFVLLQGKLLSQGELVTRVWKGVEFQWRISEIVEGRAIFVRLGAKDEP